MKLFDKILHAIGLVRQKEADADTRHNTVVHEAIRIRAVKAAKRESAEEAANYRDLIRETKLIKIKHERDWGRGQELGFRISIDAMLLRYERGSCAREAFAEEAAWRVRKEILATLVIEVPKG